MGNKLIRSNNLVEQRPDFQSELTFINKDNEFFLNKKIFPKNVR